MRLQKPLLAQILLLVSFLGGFQFLGFFPAFKIELVSEACTLLLFLMLALSAPMNSRWLLYVFLPAFGLAVFVLLYAYVFSTNENVAMFPSIRSQRYLVFFLLAPVTYMLRARGWRLADFQRVFVSAMFLAMVSRVVADFTLGPKSLLLSGSFFTLRLNQLYPETTHLLRRLDLSVLFSALYFGRRLLQARTLPSVGFSLVATTLSVLYLLIGAPRTLLVSSIIALVVYGAFLSRPGRAKAAHILLPLIMLLIALSVAQISSAVISVLWQDPSFVTRVESTQIAWEVVAEYPVFGLGQDSSGTVTYQQLVGEDFYPGDIGLLGVAVQYGSVGVILYVFGSAWLFVNLLRLLWSYTGNAGVARSKEKVFAWALFIICFTIILSTPVQARFIKPEGLTVAAFSLGLLMSRKNGRLASHRSYFSGSPQSVTNARLER
jgi:hypothetical protein